MIGEKSEVEHVAAAQANESHNSTHMTSKKVSISKRAAAILTSHFSPLTFHLSHSDQ